MSPSQAQLSSSRHIYKEGQSQIFIVHRPRDMDESFIGFGHEAQYPDRALADWRSWPAQAHNIDPTLSSFSPTAQRNDYQMLPYTGSRHVEANQES